MNQKYVLVTGSSRGLGLEIAKGLSYSGYNIILTGRDKKSLALALQKLNPKLEHIVLKIDLSKKNFLQKIVKKVRDLKVFGLVHNYGINIPNDSHPIDIEILNKSIYNNFTVSLKINEYFLKQESLKKILYIGSSASLHAKASPSYVISKGIINSYVKNVSQEYINKGILICAVLPGILAHEGSSWDIKKKLELKKYNVTKKKQPLHRFAQPTDISPYIVDIMNQKSLMLTGSILKLDANEY
jgi:short-subunit dehydrogenase